jgi:hypothetical protein
MTDPDLTPERVRERELQAAIDRFAARVARSCGATLSTVLPNAEMDKARDEASGILAMFAKMEAALAARDARVGEVERDLLTARRAVVSLANLAEPDCNECGEREDKLGEPPEPACCVRFTGKASVYACDECCGHNHGCMRIDVAAPEPKEPT